MTKKNSNRDKKTPRRGIACDDDLSVLDTAGSERHAASRQYDVKSTMVIFCVGIVTGVLVILFGPDIAGLAVKTTTFFIAGTTAIVLIATLLLVVFRDAVGQKFFAVPAVRVDEALKQLEDAARHATSKDHDAMVASALQAGKVLFSYYTINSTIRFLSSSATALLVALGGIIGAGLIVKQTEIANEQSRIARNQFALAEATKIATIQGEMTAVFDSIERAVELQDSKESGVRRSPVTLGGASINRVVTLTQILRPYASGADQQRLSPERAYLFLMLVENNIWFKDWIGKCDFSSADFNEKYLASLDFRGMRLDNADFSNCDLAFAHFEPDIDVEKLKGGKESSDADVDSIVTIMGGQQTSARSVNFSNANLSRAILSFADLKGANFDGANLSGTFVNREDFKESNIDKKRWQWLDMQTYFSKGRRCKWLKGKNPAVPPLATRTVFAMFSTSKKVLIALSAESTEREWGIVVPVNWSIEPSSDESFFCPSDDSAYLKMRPAKPADLGKKSGQPETKKAEN